MKGRIAILAAMPREIAPLVRDWPVHRGSKSGGYMIAECDRAIAICAGMGRDRVTYAFSLPVMQEPLCSVISVGYAGALRMGIARGSVHWPATVIEAETGERYLCVGGDGTLVSADHVLSSEEKPGMAEQWQADLVDMEAATVGRMAQMRGLPFRALKVVSDEVNDVLPDFNRFIDTHGGFRNAAFAAHIAVRPWSIPTAVRMGRQTAQASRTIAKALREVIEGTE